MPFATEIRRDEATRRRARAEQDGTLDRAPRSEEEKDNASDSRRRNKQRRGPTENKQR